MNEFLKHRPNFELYKILDDLVFSDEGIIPSQSLFSHIKKLYPYVDEKKIQLFINFVDINGDKKVEIQEIIKFFQQLYGSELNY